MSLTPARFSLVLYGGWCYYAETQSVRCCWSTFSSDYEEDGRLTECTVNCTCSSCKDSTGLCCEVSEALREHTHCVRCASWDDDNQKMLI